MLLLEGDLPVLTLGFAQSLDGIEPVRAQAGKTGAYLLGFLRAGVIDEQQYDLLLETAVHRRMTQKEWADAHGVAPATARSWRRRAWNAIREFKPTPR
ncbi:MAG: hypothetical protein R6V58_16460 [Planctomycetota bacterium]